MLVDDAGRPVPFQRTQSEAAVRRRDRLSFLADLPLAGIPGLPAGPEILDRCRLGKLTLARLTAEVRVAAGEHWLENERFRLEFDPQTGYLASLFDKLAGVEALAGPAAVPAVIEDRSDTWSHNVFRFLNVAEKFAADLDGRDSPPDRSRPSCRVVSECGRSRLIQDFTLYAGLDHVDVFCTVDWHEQFRMLKLLFPINVHFQAATSQIPVRPHRARGGRRRGAGRGLAGPVGRIARRPTSRTASASSTTASTATASTSARSASPSSAARSTRTTIRWFPTPRGSTRSSTRASSASAMRSSRTVGSWQEAGTVHRAAEINQGPVALAGNMGPEGFLPLSGSFLEVQPGNVVAQVLKQAEDGDGLVIRLYESAGESAHATVRLPHLDREFEADFGPSEIKTFLLPSRSSTCRCGK